MLAAAIEGAWDSWPGFLESVYEHPLCMAPVKIESKGHRVGLLGLLINFNVPSFSAAFAKSFSRLTWRPGVLAL